MQETQSSILNELVDGIAPIPGVVAIVLFGSTARGDADEYSDLDVLILFKDRASLWRRWKTIFRKAGSMNLNIHAIPETMDELNRANPVFVEKLEKHGKVLYARWPFKVEMVSPSTLPFSIVTYDLSALQYKEKMRVIYRLYEAGGSGVVGRGGSKLGPGCVLIPRDEALKLLHFLKSSGARSHKIDVLLETNSRPRFQRRESKTLIDPRQPPRDDTFDLLLNIPQKSTPKL